MFFSDATFWIRIALWYQPLTCLGLSVFVLAYYEQKSIFYFLKNSQPTTVKECVVDKQGRKDAGGRPGKPNNVAPLQTEIL
jgi:hypothetical protein